MEEDDSIIEAINFIKLQIKLNKENIKEIKKLGYDISELKSWDRIYKYILKVLLKMKGE